MFSFRSVYQRVTRQYRELMGLPPLDSLKDVEYDDWELYADERREFNEERAAARREGDYWKTGNRE